MILFPRNRKIHAGGLFIYHLMGDEEASDDPGFWAESAKTTSSCSARATRRRKKSAMKSVAKTDTKNKLAKT